MIYMQKKQSALEMSKRDYPAANQEVTAGSWWYKIAGQVIILWPNAIFFSTEWNGPGESLPGAS